MKNPQLTLLEIEALIDLANLGIADTEAWSEAEDRFYGWTTAKATAGNRGLEKLKQMREKLFPSVT